MNKVILLGRLVKDPEVRYSQAAEPVAVVKYTLAVNRTFKREGEPDADFINCVSFGKKGEFAEKYFKKGQQVGVCGRLQVRTYDDKNGQRVWMTEVLIEDQYFADSKSSSYQEVSTTGYQAAPYEDKKPAKKNEEEFFAIDESLDEEDLPF